MDNCIEPRLAWAHFQTTGTVGAYLAYRAAVKRANADALR